MKQQISDLKYLAPLGKSDHCVLSFKYICHSLDVNKCNRFLYNKANYKMMKNDLKNHDCLSEHKPIEDNWKEFKDILLNMGMFQKVKTPHHQKKKRVKFHIKEIYSWFDQAKIKTSQTLDIYTQLDLQLISETHQKYNTIRNKVKNEVMREKSSYEKKHLLKKLKFFKISLSVRLPMNPQVIYHLFLRDVLKFCQQG